jgi:hypothetical protein
VQPGDFDHAELSITDGMPIVALLRTHLKLFDDWGLSLHEMYEVALPGMAHTVVLTESDRKDSASYP